MRKLRQLTKQTNKQTNKKQAHGTRKLRVMLGSHGDEYRHENNLGDSMYTFLINEGKLVSFYI